jgi:hypothetical protein
MDSLQIQDVFDPYYVGRKPFIPKTLQRHGTKAKKDVARGKPSRRGERGDTARKSDSR